MRQYKDDLGVRKLNRQRRAFYERNVIQWMPRYLCGSSVKIYQSKEGLILEVSVKPKSREFKIVAEGEETIVYCRAEPVKGKVNKELIKELSRLFHKKVELVSGFTSKQKKLLIKDGCKGEVEAVLKQK